MLESAVLGPCCPEGGLRSRGTILIQTHCIRISILTRFIGTCKSEKHHPRTSILSAGHTLESPGQPLALPLFWAHAG